MLPPIVTTPLVIATFTCRPALHAVDLVRGAIRMPGKLVNDGVGFGLRLRILAVHFTSRLDRNVPLRVLPSTTF